MKSNYKRYIKRIIAWVMLVVMGINCFGTQLQPQIARVQATGRDSEDYQRGSEEAEDVIRAAEKEAGINVTEEEEQLHEINDEEEKTASQQIETADTGNSDKVTVYDDMIISSETTLMEDMEVGNLTIDSVLHLNGHRLTVHGNVVVNFFMYIDEGCLTVKGDFIDNYRSIVHMNSHNDKVIIEGNYIYCNNYYFDQEKNKGVWEVHGDILGGSGNVCTTHGVFGREMKLVLKGDEQQIIDIHPTSEINIPHLIIENTSEEGVFSQYMLKIDNLSDSEDKLHFPKDGNRGEIL